MRKFLLFLGLSLSILCFSQCNNTNNSHSDNNGNGKEINGKRVYTQYCILCHGADGKKGLNKAADLSKSDMALEERLEIITHGRNLMTPFRGVLSMDEIEAVAKYTMELSHGN